MIAADLIGEVPAHWGVKPLRLIGRLLKGTGGSKEDIVESGVPCVRYGDLYTTHNNFVEHARTFLSEERAQAYTSIEYGDVLFAASGETIEEIGKSAVNLLRDARCGGDIVIFRPTAPSDPRFLGYALDAAPVAAQKSLAGRGTTVKHIYPDELREVMIAVPPIGEQQVIANYLDREMARLDALVAAKERVLGLLDEKRRAIITSAVTRGVDSNALRRHSGVPWLGEIPAHWSLVMLKRVGRVCQGDAFSHSLQGQAAGEYPWFKVSDMNRPGNEMEMIAAENFVDSDVARRANAAIYDAGAVIFPRVGAALLTNKRRLLTRPSIIDDNTYAVVPSARILPRFLYLYLLLVDLARICSSGLVPTVTFSTINELTLALPSLAEQRSIVDHVARETAKLDALRTATEKTIRLLKERRIALVSAAVTGKISVDST